MAKKKKQVIKSKISTTSVSFRTKCKAHSWIGDWHDTEAKARNQARRHRNEYPDTELHNIKLDIEVTSRTSSPLND